MLHNILDGPCLESFGIHVAAMAGFPADVIREAKRKSDELEDTDPNHVALGEWDSICYWIDGQCVFVKYTDVYARLYIRMYIYYHSYTNTL